jgi:hypothetical protein
MCPAMAFAVGDRGGGAAEIAASANMNASRFFTAGVYPERDR